MPIVYSRYLWWISSSDEPYNPSLKVEAGGMEGGLVDFALGKMEAMAMMKGVLELVVDVPVTCSLVGHVLMICMRLSGGSIDSGCS